MPLLKDVAKYVRSKSAGPFWVTIDIFCRDAASFDQLRACPLLTAEGMRAVYGVDAALVKVFHIPSLGVIKISFPRPIVQGSARDADSHAGQYFAALARLPIDTAPSLRPA